MQKSLVIVVLLVGALIAYSAATPHRKPKRLGNPGNKIFDYLDKQKKGELPTEQVKAEVKKLLPLSDVKNIDSDSNGVVTKKEFREFYDAQFEEWKSNNFIQKKP
ncbi:hypothetical protein M3Y96_00014600 [Aphelenchoides besseyi]|nr:hypothetical protein M3Y96_00014600 [Aphelenchoides besseyi]